MIEGEQQGELKKTDGADSGVLKTGYETAVKLLDKDARSIWSIVGGMVASNTFLIATIAFLYKSDRGFQNAGPWLFALAGTLVCAFFALILRRQFRYYNLYTEYAKDFERRYFKDDRQILNDASKVILPSPLARSQTLIFYLLAVFTSLYWIVAHMLSGVPNQILSSALLNDAAWTLRGASDTNIQLEKNVVRFPPLSLRHVESFSFEMNQIRSWKISCPASSVRRAEVGALPMRAIGGGAFSSNAQIALHGTKISQEIVPNGASWSGADVEIEVRRVPTVREMKLLAKGAVVPAMTAMVTFWGTCVL